jgi:ABC-2 type transport system ATP-binding protein
MIKVENLSRRYGEHLAVRDVSFEVARGEVVGLLGPNGAGKTTTMRILSGSLGATGGRALVCGRDVALEPREVKRRVGYMPEHPPLYTNMTVGEYLRFAARIKGVDDPAAATARTVERVGLAEVQGRLVAHLSKGFQQRVGLAQALVHDPELLILDEPTSGLDPAQRKEIRELIRELIEGDRTVILSTHVLPEVEQICQRVVIIAQGRIVAEDRIDALASDQRRIRLQVERPDPALHRDLAAIPGVRRVQALEGGHYELDTSGDVRAEVARAAASWDLLELRGRELLEDAYLRLTELHEPRPPSTPERQDER